MYVCTLLLIFVPCKISQWHQTANSHVATNLGLMFDLITWLMKEIFSRHNDNINLDALLISHVRNILWIFFNKLSFIWQFIQISVCLVSFYSFSYWVSILYCSYASCIVVHGTIKALQSLISECINIHCPHDSLIRCVQVKSSTLTPYKSSTTCAPMMKCALCVCVGCGVPLINSAGEQREGGLSSSHRFRSLVIWRLQIFRTKHHQVLDYVNAHPPFLNSSSMASSFVSWNTKCTGWL